ncbi:right-handed parallel beta-helix repeat-containing protein [Pseudonocardia yuanmonensis]|uniref:Right-handed parallel beta-helix repeat-containing protein n=1 Tax=Pseudonocardia yuanmonensis TaxID=1095914 RepID=A0ABP8VY64_9PSEU
MLLLSLLLAATACTGGGAELPAPLPSGPAEISGGTAVDALPEELRIAVPGPPRRPPARICDDAATLDGPGVQPPGSIAVGVDDDLDHLTAANPARSVFWLRSGVHRLKKSVVPKDGNTYIGAPGAIVDGENRLNIAFWEEYFRRSVDDVTLAHLTIQNFTASSEDQGAVYAGTGWTISHSTFRNNGYIALFAGSHNTIRYSCFDSNGQLGVGTYRLDGKPSSDIVVDRNEFRRNNTRRLSECGCAGGMKWWEAQRGSFTNNWVHGNNGPGVWADNNNIDMLFEGNFINDNTGQGIFYEISYNFMIRGNSFVRNALERGARETSNFPMAAVYISEAGGVDVPGFRFATSEIAYNYFEDNWDGVALWESGNRYAGVDGGDATPSYGDRTRWKTQNILVHHNEFRMNKENARCVGRLTCGRNGLFSDWVPVPGPPLVPNTSHDEYQIAVSFKQNNVFQNNMYAGEWLFVAYDQSLTYGWTTWRDPRPDPLGLFTYAAPEPYGFAQDAGSSMS